MHMSSLTYSNSTSHVVSHISPMTGLVYSIPSHVVVMLDGVVLIGNVVPEGIVKLKGASGA